MKILHYFAWTLFVVTLGLAIYKDIDLNYTQQIPYNLISLQLSDDQEGLTMLEEWRGTPTQHDTTLLQEAETQIKLDCLFLLSYTILLIILSYNQMQKVGQKLMNTLLRLNFPLAIITGLLNAIGNGILLSDMLPYRIGVSYTSIHWLSMVKFGLGAWIILMLIASLLFSPPRSTSS
jgi:hypothetical protein